MANLKCIKCIEEFLELSPDDEARVDGSAWLKVRDADTLVPSWQQMAVGPGSMAFAVTAVPFCVPHMEGNIARPSQTEQIARRSGLAIPGMN
jgi:hypothetical protein